MKTDYDKQRIEEELVAYVTDKWNIVRGFFRNLDIISSILNRYAFLASMAQSILNVFTMLPAILGPVTLMISIVELFFNFQISIASKLVGLFANIGATTTNIAALFLQAIAMPLLIVAAALGVVKELWSLGELHYRRSNGEYISQARINESRHDLVIATLTLIGAILIFTPVAPLGYGILAFMGIYRLADSLGFNPLRKYTNLFKEDSKESQQLDATPQPVEKPTEVEIARSSANITSRLNNTPAETPRDADEIDTETVQLEATGHEETVTASIPLHSLSLFSYLNDAKAAMTSEELKAGDDFRLSR